MPSQRNIDQLKQLKDKLDQAKSIVFTDYSGLSVDEQSELRAAVKEVGGEFTVAKNTLLRLALASPPATLARSAGGRGDTSNTFGTSLRGPTAVLLSYQNELMPLKAMVEFAKAHDRPTVKAGLLEGKLLSVEQVMELAMLPGFEELIVRLIKQIQGPMYGLTRVLNGNITKLVLALKAIGEQNNLN